MPLMKLQHSPKSHSPKSYARRAESKVLTIYKRTQRSLEPATAATPPQRGHRGVVLRTGWQPKTPLPMGGPIDGTAQDHDVTYGDVTYGRHMGASWVAAGPQGTTRGHPVRVRMQRPRPGVRGTSLRVSAPGCLSVSPSTPVSKISLSTAWAHACWPTAPTGASQGSQNGLVLAGLITSPTCALMISQPELKQVLQLRAAGSAPLELTHTRLLRARLGRTVMIVHRLGRKPWRITVLPGSRYLPVPLT
jgi:hypothetical protein